MFNCKKLIITLGQKELVKISFGISSSLSLVGESGSGKSLTLKALIGMLPKEMACDKEIECDFELRRGESIAYIPQNPFTALSPLTKIKKQFFCENVKERLELVSLDSSLLERYPPELSGGQLQRVIIAMALNRDVRLMLLDEPTTALDTQNKEKIIMLIKELQAKMGFKVLFVSHDIKSASLLCEEIAVIKSGRIIEHGLTKSVTESPKENYSKQLLESGFAYRSFRG